MKIIYDTVFQIITSKLLAAGKLVVCISVRKEECCNADLKVGCCSDDTWFSWNHGFNSWWYCFQVQKFFMYMCICHQPVKCRRDALWLTRWLLQIVSGNIPKYLPSLLPLLMVVPWLKNINNLIYHLLFLLQVLNVIFWSWSLDIGAWSCILVSRSLVKTG